MGKPSLITIDGPVAVGKSTVGNLVAQKLGYRFIDTGMMYRAVTWLALYRGINSNDETALSRLASEANIEVVIPCYSRSEGILSSIGYREEGFPAPSENMKGDRCESAIFIEHQDISHEIYLASVDSFVSQVSRIAGVRHAMVAQQQQLAKGGKVVMAGRDIGTVVLPHAELKIFLDAPVRERARRRYQERAAAEGIKYVTVLAELKRRDEIDTHRSYSPLHPASDAHIIDTGELTVSQIVGLILSLVERR